MKSLSQATMSQVRTTKGAVLYEKDQFQHNDEHHRALTTLYLRKEGLDEPYPQEIVVTIAAKEKGE